MPWSGGVYTRGYPSWTNDANANLPISATKFDLEDNDFAAGLNNCLTIDGLNKPNATLNWTQTLNLTRASDGTPLSVGRTGGTNNPALQFSLTESGGVSALNATGTTAQLQLQTNGVTALTVNNSQIASFANAPTAAAWIPTGSSVPANGIYLPAANTLGFASNSTQWGQVNSTGNWSLLAPSSGSSLNVKTLDGSSGAIVLDSTTTSTGYRLQFNQQGVIRGYVGLGANTITGASSGDMGISAQTGNLNLSGSSSAVHARVTNAGVLQAVDDGGTLQTVGWRDLPVNNVAGGYTLVLADRGKEILVSSGNVTIPANASVAFPLGTTIVVVNNTAGSISVSITSDQLFLAGTATAGTRTVAANGICTLIKAYSATQWAASGPGVT